MVWSGVAPIYEDRPCDICKSIDGVEHQQNEIRSGGCVKSVFTHSQSNLCQKCKSQGWLFFSVDVHGKVSYYNTQTREFKHL